MKWYEVALYIIVISVVAVATWFVAKNHYDKPILQIDTVIIGSTAYPIKIDSFKTVINKLENENIKLQVNKSLWKHRYDNLKDNPVVVRVYDTVHVKGDTTVNYYATSFNIINEAFSLPVKAFADSPVDSLVPGNTSMKQDYIHNIFNNGYIEGKKDAEPSSFWRWVERIGIGGACLYVGSRFK